MADKDIPIFGDYDEAESSLRLLKSGRTATETIDLDNIFSSDVTKSGSFNVRQIKAASFSQLLNALPLPALLVSDKHKIIFANRACGKISEQYEIMKRARFATFVADHEESENTDDLLQSVFTTRKSFVRELRITIGDKTIWGRVSFRAIRISGDRYVLILIEDLSLEKQQLLITKRQQDELEKRVKERTAELNRLNKQLMQEIAQRKEAEDRIKASLAEKEVMLQEIHHRVKNNLQIVSSLLGLHARQVSDESVIEALKDSQGRVKSMALIHEQLYESGDLAAIDFSQYLTNLTRAVSLAYADCAGAVSFKLEAAPVLFRVETAIPLGLIVSELLSNCLKHAFPDGKGGEIRVELQSGDNESYTLLVADNGIGLPDGFDYRKAKSLGLRLVNELTETQLGGRLESRINNGAELRIVFKPPAPVKRTHMEWQRQM